MVEPRVHLRVIPIRRRGEPLDRPHHRVDALVLVAVDTALDEDRHLHVAALDQLLCPARIALRQLDDLPQARVAVALSVRVERVDRDLVHVVTAGGRADHPDLHAPPAAARDVLERAADRVVRNVREASGRVRGVGAVGQVLRGVGHRFAAPRSNTSEVLLLSPCRRRRLHRRRVRPRPRGARTPSSFGGRRGGTCSGARSAILLA